MPNIPDWVDTINLLLGAIIDGRIEAKTMRQMTPEQLTEFHAKLVRDEKSAIDAGKNQHMDDA